MYTEPQQKRNNICSVIKYVFVDAILDNFVRLLIDEYTV